jgi:hypothetical protein
MLIQLSLSLSRARARSLLPTCTPGTRRARHDEDGQHQPTRRAPHIMRRRDLENYGVQHPMTVFLPGSVCAFVCVCLWPKLAYKAQKVTPPSAALGGTESAREIPESHPDIHKWVSRLRGKIQVLSGKQHTCFRSQNISASSTP